MRQLHQIRPARAAVIYIRDVGHHRVFRFFDQLLHANDEGPGFLHFLDRRDKHHVRLNLDRAFFRVYITGLYHRPVDQQVVVLIVQAKDPQVYLAIGEVCRDCPLWQLVHILKGDI